MELTHKEEVDWLKGWLAGRLAWIDNQDFPPPAMHVANNRLSGTNEIRLACLVGKIYYATNGRDPRQSGGLPSPAAFEEPIILSRNYGVFGPIPSLAFKLKRIRSNGLKVGCSRH